jgi:hypothetical protein
VVALNSTVGCACVFWYCSNFVEHKLLGVFDISMNCKLRCQVSYFLTNSVFVDAACCMCSVGCVAILIIFLTARRFEIWF